MEPVGQFAGDLNAGGCAKGGQNGLGIGLGVKGIDRTAAVVGAARGGSADQKAGRLQGLLAGLTAVKDRADLEQGKVHEAAGLIARRGAQEAGQKVGAQVRHLGRDRVVDAHSIRSATEQGGGGAVDEAVGHAFIVAKGGDGAARCPFAGLHRRQDGPGHARGGAGQGLALQFGKRGDAGDFFDQIGVAEDVGAPRGRGDLIAVEGKTQRVQGLALLGFGNVHADKADDPCRVQGIGAGGVGGLAVHGKLGRRAAAEVEDHLRGKIEARQREGGIDAALKAVAGVGIDLLRAAGGGDGDRVPEGGFKENLGGVRGAARGLPAHDSGERLRAVVVRDQHLAGAKPVALAVQRLKFLAALGGMDAKGATDPGDVKNMQRAVQADGEEIGDVDQRRNGAQADGPQSCLQPRGRGAVGDARNGAAGEMRATPGLEAGLDGDPDPGGSVALDHRNIQRFQRAKTACGKVAGNAAHAQRIGAVGRNLDMDHRIGKTAIVDEAGP